MRITDLLNPKGMDLNAKAQGKNEAVSYTHLNDILEASLNTGVITGAVVIDMDLRAAADYANVLYVQNPAGGSAARIELLGGALYALSLIHS